MRVFEFEPLPVGCYEGGVSDATRLLHAAEHGDAQAAAELLPLVYEELRRLAAHKLSQEAAGHTLQPTALVHEAWLRLVGDDGQKQFANRAHFFFAAAEAMRRILVDRARRRQAVRHGGGQARVDLDAVELPVPTDDETLVRVSEALDELARLDATEAEVVKLRFFVGLKQDEIASALGISEKTVQRHWTHAKAWLYTRVRPQPGGI
ncbi:MAG: ECF subfamily RNA polymerase sigma-24 factor [Limisphaerales bacterium]|nr:MAG: ECF subfamily RNA polymerase sigma-24 factor [Limisphaerales bacterium]TXT46417.1 MAG: ECF subfamily RNA polymerase sigma-24 factor [Limisphaerales bacterium]